MLLETKIVGRRTPFERRPIRLLEVSYTLRSLLTELVAQEVAAYQTRQNSAGILRILTEKELIDGASAGKIQLAPQRKGEAVTVETATHTALRGFGDGLYYVFVDDQQIEALDEVLTLSPDSTLLLLRLTALAGG